MKFALAAAAFLAAATPGPSMAAEGEVIDVASVFPLNFPYLGVSVLNLTAEIEKLTEGSIKFKVHGAGDLVPAFEVFDAVSSGAIPAGWDWVGWWAGKIPVSNLMGAMPFGPSPTVFLSWMWEGGGMEILQRAYDPYNVQVLPCHVTDPEPAGWFNKEINTVADFEGLRFRISGLGGEVLNRLGASTMAIPSGEVYLAMELGRIDGTELSLPEIDKNLGLNKVAKYYYFPGWHQPSSWNSLIINKDVWNGFTPHEQDIIWAACRANIARVLGSAAEPQVDALAEFEASGVEVRRLPDEVLAELYRVSQEVLAEHAAKDPLFKEAFESLSAYMPKLETWYTLQSVPRP